MPNEQRGEVEIEIGGATRVLRLSFNGIAELETLHDTPATELFSAKGLKIRLIRDAIAIGLKGGGDRKVTPEMVGRWMDKEPKRLFEWGEALAKAFALSLGEDPDEDERNEKSETEGSSSGPFGETGRSTSRS